jgi:hypothetical protein
MAQAPSPSQTEGDIMFASLFVSPQPSSRARKIFQRVAFGLIALAEIAQATAAPLCTPALAFQQVGFSPIKFHTMRLAAR